MCSCHLCVGCLSTTVACPFLDPMLASPGIRMHGAMHPPKSCLGKVFNKLLNNTKIRHTFNMMFKHETRAVSPPPLFAEKGAVKHARAHPVSLQGACKRGGHQGLRWHAGRWQVMVACRVCGSCSSTTSCQKVARWPTRTRRQWMLWTSCRPLSGYSWQRAFGDVWDECCEWYVEHVRHAIGVRCMVVHIP